MTYLVRKISRAKWEQNKILDGAEVSADAITICSKTRENSLSTWEIEDERYVDEAVLALASTFQKLDKIDVIILDPKILMASGLSISKSKGDTHVSDLVETHVDIVNLTYKSLGTFADCVVGCFKGNKVKLYTRAMVKNILKTAIKSGRLDDKQIDQKLVAELH